jgi:hypothetical protein
MRTRIAILVSVITLSCVSSITANADEPPTPAQRDETLRRYDLDPAVPLASRVQPTPQTVLKMFEELGGPAPMPHTLTESERRTLSAAFAALPPLHRRILTERLRSVSFLDGMPNTALTSTINPNEPFRLFDITIRAGIFRNDVSEWLTEKERTCFDSTGSPLSVSIEAGKLDAILYVLLHEATHVVDSSLGLTPAVHAGDQPSAPVRPTPFTEGIWTDRLTAASQYRDSLLEHTRFRPRGGVIPIGQAERLYIALRKAPFVSVYGSSNWYDDLAEYLTLYHLTEKLHQPYRIVLRNDGHEAFVYEPLKSDLVRRRFGQMKRFYEEAS